MAKTYSFEDFASEPAQTFSFADFEEKPKTFSLADFEPPVAAAPTPTPVAAAPTPTPVAATLTPTPTPTPTLEPAPVVTAPTPALTPEPTAQVPQDSPPYEPAKPTGFMSTLKEAGFGAVPENPNQYIPQAYKGIMSGVVGLGSLWEGVNIGADASALNIAAKQLSNFDQIDAGTLKSSKQFLGKPSSQTFIDNAQYMNGDEATRAAIRKKYAADIGQRKDFIQSSLATLEKYKEFAKQYKGRVEDFTSVEGVRDFTDWLKFNMGSAGVQLAPIIIAAVTTGGLGAGLVGMSMAGGEQINNRIAFVLNQKDVKALSPEGQAAKVEKYVQDTMGVSMAVAAANGALDAVTGPVGAILRAKFAKEAAKAAGKEITGDVALKQAVKEIPRSVIEESFTGLTQEAFSILGEKYLGEQNLDFFDPENRKRLINAMASEGVGGLVGGGFNVGAAAKRFQTASEETKAQLNQLGQTLLNSVEGSSFTKEGIDAQAVDALNPNQKVAPTSLDDMAPPLTQAAATEQKTTPPIGAVTTPPEEEAPVSKAASYVPAGTPVQQKAAPPEQPAPKVVEYIDMETGEIIPSDQADPRVEYTNRETGEVIPPTEVETTKKTITPEIEQQIKDEAARYAREYNLPLDLATDIIRGQHARGDLDAKRTPAKSVTGRIEPSFSVLKQGAATAQGVAPSDTTGLAGPVENIEPPVAGEGTKPAPLGDIPTLTKRPPAATYAQLDPDSKAGVLQEAQGMWESGEANLPMAKAWNSLPSWKRDMFAQEVYANYDEMTTNGEVFRAAMDKVIQAKKPEEAKAPEFKADVQAEMPFAAETPAAPVGPITFAELPKAEKDTVMETAKNVWQTGEISLPIEKSWNSLPNWKRELFAERIYAGGEDFVNDRDQWYGVRKEIAGLEKNPATTKEPATKTAEPITGFKTSKGSEYVVDETGKTSRTKKSPGEGQGETFAPHNAVYVDTAAQNAILEDMQGLFGTGGSIRIGYVANNAFNTINDLNQLPKGVEPVVAVINTQTKQAVAVHKASTQPEIGLHPVEKLYNNDGTSSTHLGNDITEITKSPATETPKTQTEINKERQAAQKAAETPVAETPASQDIPQNILDLHQKYERMTAMANERIPSEPNAQGVYPRPQDLKREETMSFRRLLKAVEDFTGDTSGEPSKPALQMLTRLSELSRAENEKAEAVDTPKTQAEINQERQAAQKAAAAAPVEETPAAKTPEVKAKKPTAKERKAQAEQKMFDLLGAKVGDTITFSQDIGYITANKPLVISSISNAGEMSVTDPSRGSSTSEKLSQIQAQAGRGLTWEVTPASAKTPTEKPKRGAPVKVKTPEEQAQYKADRAALQKQINQAANRVTSLINLLSKNIDSTPLDKRRDAIDELNKFATSPETRTKDRSGKRAKSFLAQSDKITATERNALATRLANEKSQAPKPLAAYAQTASEPVKAFYKFTTATQAISHIMRNGTPFERALAARLKPFLTDVRLIVADADAHPDIVKILNGTDKGTSASGAYSSRVFGNDTRSMIVLRGENFAGKPGQQGVNNVIFLHEALHAATEAKIAQYEKLIAEGRPVPIKLEEMISELRGTMAAAKAHYEKLKASGAPIPPSVRHAFETVGIATFPEEFVAYGMTNPDVQLFLLQAPGGMRQDKAIGFWKNLFNRFVNTMREAFDMDNTHQSALQDLMLITEGLMQLQETAPASTAGVQLAAKNLNNKITKADKDLKKVQQSHDLSGGIKLFKDAGDIRTFENYETLFKANWDSMAVSAKLSILGALPTSSIIDWKGDQVPALKRIDELVQRASGLRQNLLAGYARKADALGRFVSEHGDYGTGKLATAMHLARLSSVTPSVYADRADALANDPRVVNFNKLLTDPRTNPNELNAIKNKLNERIASIEATFNAYDALRPIKGAQDMYKMVRQFYKDANALTRTLLDQNIDKLQLEGNVNDPSTPKGKLMLAVRRMYEDSEFKGVEEYFPFMRHGDQRLDVAGPDGKETYFFDTTKERKLAIEQRAKQLGVKPNDGNIFTVSNESHADSKNVAAKESRMLTEMFRIIEDATAKPGVNKDDLKDQLYQVYLSTLPEASYRKQYMHAENVTGFTSDIFRNFQTSATRIANQATKLRYGQEVDNEIQAAKDTLEGMPPNMQEELKGFVNEVAIRAREEFDPRPQSRVANGLTQFAYYWLLSGAASAAIQTTALPIFVMSHLNPQYGYGKSAAKLARWMNVYNSMSFTTDTYEGEKTLTAPTVRESSLFDKNPILQRAFDEALARNVINQLSGTPYSDSNRTPTNARNNLPRVALRETANLMSGLFTGAERLTREVAYMMTFELEYEKSGDFDKAVQKAVDMVHNQLGRFDTFDTPRLLRNGLGKVAFQFKPYAAVVTKIFVKGYLAATTPGQRSEGLQILSGILLMGAMLHGVTGMPLYTMICDVIDGILDDLEDDEKRKRRIARYKQVYGEDSISDDWGIEYVKDKEARIAHDVFTATNSDMRFRYEFLPKFTGGLKYTTDSGRIMDLAQMLEKGPVSVATDMNIGSRTSFNNIWLKEIREGKDFEEQVKNTVEAFTPPSISAVMNVVKGVSGMAKGETRKGIEQASPAAVANPLKAERVSREGITNKENELILGKSELSNANIVAQVTGLTSTRAASLEENKFKFVAENAKAEKRRQVILGDLKKAYLNESIPLEEQDKAQVKVNNQIDQYNRRYPVPGLIIDGDTISDTLGNAFEARGMSSRGMHINDARMPNLRALRERLVPGQPK